MINPEFGARLSEAFNNVGIGEISRKLGLSYHAARNYLKGRVPGPEVLLSISNVTQCSIHWLLTGEGPKRALHLAEEPALYKLEGEGEYLVYLGEAERKMVTDLAADSGRDFADQVREMVIEGLIGRGLVSDKAEGANLIFFSDQVPKLVPMRLIGTIAAGQPIQTFEQDEIVMVAEDFVVRGRGGFVLRVAGDSMMDDGIHDGDLVICYESKTATNGQMVVALIGGDEATVKRFYKEKGRIRLQPANPRYKPLLLPFDQVRIQGIVVGIQRRP